MQRTDQKGFSLIEVLIAVLVLAIGLLGLASLQLKSIQTNQQSYYLSQVDNYLNDIVNRMRANSTELSQYLLAVDETAATPASTDTLAVRERYQWQQTVLEKIIPGRTKMSIQRQTGTDNIYEVSIMWDPNPGGTFEISANNCGVEVGQNRCAILVAEILP